MVAPWACSLPDKIIYAGPGGYFPAERQEIMRYSEQQRAYNQARQASELAGARAAAHERAFLVARGAMDRRGRPARCLWQIENDAVFDALEAEYQSDPEAVKLQKADMAARAALIKAEKALVAWALSIVPTGIRATLAPAAETDHTTRKKIIDLAMRLDASTVSHRVV